MGSVCVCVSVRWRDNPMLPDGLWYEGVSEEPLQLSGGSAAQSSTIQSLDVLLGIQHDKDSGGWHICETNEWLIDRLIDR